MIRGMTEPSSAVDAIDEARPSAARRRCNQRPSSDCQDFGGTSRKLYALVADGIESTSDILSSLIVWSGFRFPFVALSSGCFPFMVFSFHGLSPSG